MFPLETFPLPEIRVGSSLPPDCFVSRGIIPHVFLNILFYTEGLLAPRPTPKLEDHPLSAVCDCLFKLFAATLLIGGRFSIRNLRTRHAVVTGTHYKGLVKTTVTFHGERSGNYNKGHSDTRAWEITCV